MKFLVLLLVTTFSLSGLAARKTVFSCQLPGCEGCSLVADLKQGKAEYMNNESSYVMNRISKSDDKEAFKIPEGHGFRGYRLVFKTKQWRADLHETSSEGVEKRIYKDLPCKYAEGQIADVEEKAESGKVRTESGH